MNLKEFIKQTFLPSDGFCIRPQIICNDGFSMSVQGSAYHCCEPRVTQDWYNSLEIGYPSAEESLIADYAEDPENLTGTVYGRVPIEIIEAVIEKHGGINLTPHIKTKIDYEKSN